RQRGRWRLLGSASAAKVAACLSSDAVDGRRADVFQRACAPDVARPRASLSLDDRLGCANFIPFGSVSDDICAGGPFALWAAIRGGRRHRPGAFGLVAIRESGVRSGRLSVADERARGSIPTNLART